MSAAAPRDPRAVSVHAVPGIGEVTPATDLPRVLVTACAAAGVPLGPGDVLCVASKVVSKWLGLGAADREAAVAADTRTTVARRATPRGVTVVVRSAAGPVMAGAGVDESNTGPSGAVLRLPAEPDEVARRLRREVAAAMPSPAGLTGGAPGAGASPGGGPPPAVVLTDTAGRPWRDGQVDFALGVAGLAPVDDARGRPDADGRVLAVTVRALADEVAAAADLVKGKVAGVPAAVVRGLAGWVSQADGPGAARLVRDPEDDWFRRGAVEAVHEALGVAAGEPGAPVVPGRLPDGDLGRALARVAAVAGHREVPGASLTLTAHAVLASGDPVGVGRLVERLLAAAAAEDLTLTASPASAGAWRVAPPPAQPVRSDGAHPWPAAPSTGGAATGATSSHDRPQ
jgi:coenzyme F420-0:L-glutamate ligase/coenzyme F420-1:gamma-L-glutamate ligase